MIIRSVIDFVIGFCIGTILEYIVVLIYTKIDPNAGDNPNKVKLALAAIGEMVVLFYLMEKLDNKYTTMGMFASQVFIFDYALTKIYSPAQKLLE